MEILITGGAGYVGSVLVPLLLEKGYRVKALDNLMYNQNPFSNIFDDNFSFIEGSVTNEEDLKKSLNGVDMILHLAAIVGVPSCDRNPKLALEVNVNGTILLNKLRKEIPIIFISSDSIYGDLKGTVTEESSPCPINLYSKTKYEGEKIIKKSDNYIIFRPVSSFGSSPRMRIDLLINNFVYDSSKVKEVIIYEAESSRTFIHVKDFARGLLFGIENFDSMKNGIYNLGNDDLVYSKKEIIKLIKKYLDFKLIISKSQDEHNPRFFNASCKKIRNRGFVATVSIEEGIRELIYFYKNISSKLENSN